MTRTNTKNVETLALLLVVALAPSSIAFAQTADTETDTDDKRKDKIKDQIKKRIVKDAIPRSNVERTDRVADLTFRGQTDGWTILGGTAFKSSIALSGDAYSYGSGNWKIKSVGDITVADKTAKLDLTGHARGTTILLQGTGTLSDGQTIKLILKGHFAPTSETNVYAIAFTNAGIQYLDNGVSVPLMQVGSVLVTPTVPTPTQAQ
ncbi:MAG: exported protein of unknown function [Candidatus Nitrosotenuis sp.]|nr:exported protein of unknown function [Candidatus Nitrosotenuis sp.]